MANTTAEDKQAQKPDEPSDLSKPTWKHILKRTKSEFSDDQCTDLAAALTYYAILSIFPMFIALISLLGIFGQGRETTDALVKIVEDVAPGSASDTFATTIEGLVSNQAAGPALFLGLLTALWSASGYVGAFGRATNRIYEVDEGRPFYKLRPLQLLMTFVGVVMLAIVAVGLVVTGPLAEAVGGAIGLGDQAVTVWNWAKWPVLILIVTLLVAGLYYLSPNVKQPKFTWISMGAGIAIVTWVLASVAFAFYVSNFGSYNKTYGTLAGAVVFLLWLWITNLALLFGAEFDAEAERGRQLQAGLPAEQTIQLPPRDTKKIEKNEAKEAKAVEEARKIRASHGNEPS